MILGETTHLMKHQIDTVLAVKRYLESGVQPLDTSENKRGQKRIDKLYQGIGARQISAFLGEANWSKSKVADLLKLNNHLDHEIVTKLTRGQNDRAKGQIIQT